MKERRTILVRILEWGTISSSMGLIFTVILQVVTRKFLIDFAPSWTEEASRFFFIYAISFGAGLAQMDGSYVSVDYFYRKFRPGIRSILDHIRMGVTIVLFLLMTIFSVFFIVLGTEETSPSLNFPMSYVFASMFILSGSVLYYLIMEWVHKIKSEIR